MQYGQTPLHWAAANGHLDVVTLLLKEGAAVAAVDEVTFIYHVVAMAV